MAGRAQAVHFHFGQQSLAKTGDREAIWQYLASKMVVISETKDITRTIASAVSAQTQRVSNISGAMAEG
ncbi:hypothetical protein HA075_20365 [bacterium BFN5]|nr:hypothetical protein HA075_20365 [bacterium BFN5]